MDEIFGYMDERFEVSLADSTMMWIVHYAMNRAEEKMKAKTGVLERLNEISKFYELAVMQLEGCLSIVHAETESSFLESNHEEVLNDLREIRDRLQWRLNESELAILEKDRELTQRLENELQLRHALELKERELASCLGIETSRINEDSDGDLCELRTTTVDQQKLNIKQGLVQPQHDMLSEVQQHSGIGRNKVEEMGSDIEKLKQTMDLAFGKMQSALFLCEMGPKEREWKLKIEKDVMSILIGSIMREFQENIEAEVRKDEDQVLKVWKEHWPRLMNEFSCLQHEIATFHDTYAEDSDCSAISSPATTKPSSPEGSNEISNRFNLKMEEIEKEEKSREEEENEESNFVAKMIKNHESIIRQKSEKLNWRKHGILQEKKASSSNRRKQLNHMKERMLAVTEKLDNLINWNARLSESLFNQSDIHDKEPFPGRELSEINEVHASKDVDTWGSATEKVKGACDAGNQNQEELLRVSHIENEYNTMQNWISKDVCGSIDGLVEDFDSKYCNFNLEKQMQDHVYKCYLREVINEWNENIERNTTERNITDDINFIVLSEAVKDISANQEFALVKGQCHKADERCIQCSASSNKADKIKNTISEDICMLIFRKTVDDFNNIMEDFQADSVIRKQIHQIVFGETMKNFINIATSASKEHTDSIQNNFLDQLEFIILEISLKEDVCIVVFKTMLKEWNLELDNYYMENFIREKIQQVILVETLNDAFLSNMEVKSPVEDNIMEGGCSTEVQGKENMTTTLLESLLRCFEAEENLMLSAKSEINEHSKQLDLGSECGDLHEHEIFEDLLTGEEQTFSSLTRKVENVLQQLGISKALLRELGSSLGHSVHDSKSFHNQMSTNEEGQLKLSSSSLLSLLNLLLTIADFGAMICQKFEMMTKRLEKLKCCLDPITGLVDCLRNKKLLYQKAFIKRCQNLQKAEVEVDLLGDQVDALLTLLEKIYVALRLQAPALQQYFEVYEILELIKRELIGGSVQASSVVT